MLTFARAKCEPRIHNSQKLSFDSGNAALRNVVPPKPTTQVRAPAAEVQHLIQMRAVAAVECQR